MKKISILIPVLVVGVTVMGYASNTNSTQTQSPPSSPNMITIVKDGGEAGPGPLTKENVSLGNLRIGDSQEKVESKYGKPTTASKSHGSPFLLWYYKDLNLYLEFFRASESDSPEGVVSIQIQNPSNLRLNNGIGIGDSLESMIKNYGKVSGAEVNNEKIQNVWINGSNKDNNMYYPSLHVVLKNGKITMIELTNQEHRP